jgi:hypothetical protein
MSALHKRIELWLSYHAIQNIYGTHAYRINSSTATDTAKDTEQVPIIQILYTFNSAVKYTFSKSTSTLHLYKPCVI